jgi:hypothetical protein
MRGKLETNLSFEVTAFRAHVDAIPAMIYTIQWLTIDYRKFGVNAA